MFAFPHRRVLGVAFALALSSALAGCGSIPLKTLVQLSRVDSSTTDLAKLAAAVKAPLNLKPLPGKTVLVMTMTIDGKEETVEFVLAEYPEARGAAAIEARPRPDQRFEAYRIAPSDLARAEATRARFLEKRAEAMKKGVPGKFSIGVSSAGCRLGPVPAGPVRVSTYLATEETRGFITLMEGYDLREAVAAKGLEAVMPLCDAPDVAPPEPDAAPPSPGGKAPA